MFLLLAALSLSVLEPQDAAESADRDLARIRQSLTAPAPRTLAPSLPEPTFRVGVVANAPLIIGPSDWTPPAYQPRLPGGLYAFEQRQRSGNPWAGQPLIKLDVVPLVTDAIAAVRKARREAAVRAAHANVAAELAAFCALMHCQTVASTHDH